MVNLFPVGIANGGGGGETSNTAGFNSASLSDPLKIEFIEGEEKVALVDLGGGTYSTDSPTVSTKIILLDGETTIPVSDIFIPSDTLVNDTDIKVAFSLDDGAYSSFYELDNNGLNKLYPIKAGQISGNEITCTKLQIKIQLNSDGTTYQECGQPEISGVTTLDTLLVPEYIAVSPPEIVSEEVGSKILRPTIG